MMNRPGFIALDPRYHPRQSWLDHLDTVGARDIATKRLIEDAKDRACRAGTDAAKYLLSQIVGSPAQQIDVRTESTQIQVRVDGLALLQALRELPPGERQLLIARLSEATDIGAVAPAE